MLVTINLRYKIGHDLVFNLIYTDMSNCTRGNASLNLRDTPKSRD